MMRSGMLFICLRKTWHNPHMFTMIRIFPQKIL